MKKVNVKNLKFGINNAVIISFTVVFVILLNIAAVLLEERVPKIRWDLTEDAVTKIGGETKKLLESLDERETKVELIYLKGTGDVDKRAKGILEQYDAYCDNIEYSVVNYHKNPKYLESFGINSDSNVDGSILVTREDKSKARLVAASDMRISYQNNTVYLLENLLTNAIGVVSEDKQMTVCFTVGHGEIIETVQKNPASQNEEQGGLMLINLIKSQNIAAYQYDITTGEIPDNVDLVIIMAPTKDFTKGELDSLDDYMLRGGNVAVAYSSGIVLERLESYLETWGIKVNNDIICESDSSVKFDETGIYFYSKTADDAIGENVGRVITSYARSLEFEPTGDIEGRVILETGDSAGSMPIKENGIDRENIAYGKFDLGYILEKPLNGNFDETAKLIVTSAESVWGVTRETVTNYDSIVYYSLSESSFGNSQFVMNVLSEVFGEEIQSIYVPVKSQKISVLTMSETYAFVMGKLLGVVIPMGILAAGLIVWLRRRNK